MVPESKIREELSKLEKDIITLTRMGDVKTLAAARSAADMLHWILGDTPSDQFMYGG